MMKILVSILVFGAVLGGLSSYGIIGSPSSTLDSQEIQRLTSLPLEPIRQSMSVSQAYRAIPHPQQTFRMNQSVLQATEAEYLDQAFTLVDLAVVERVSLLRTVQREGNQSLPLKNYEQILKRFLAISVPPRLDYFHQQVAAAIGEEHAYYEGLQKGPSVTTVNRSHPLIQSLHRRLWASYQFLVSEYPQESPNNQQAFFEHLCALDFI